MEHDDKGGKTIGLLLRLTKPVWGTGKVVILDSGFCVLKGIIELKKQGVLAGALVKKRRYWPKYIRGDDIIAHFESKEVGDVDAWHGIPFHLSCALGSWPGILPSGSTTLSCTAAGSAG
jgi:hypothetical protein